MFFIKNINRLFLAYLNLYTNNLNIKLRIFITFMKKSNRTLISNTKGVLSLRKDKGYLYKKNYN